MPRFPGEEEVLRFFMVDENSRKESGRLSFLFVLELTDSGPKLGREVRCWI